MVSPFGIASAEIDASCLLTPREAMAAKVLNGIAHDHTRGKFFITGKLWPTLFEVTFDTEPKGSDTDDGGGGCLDTGTGSGAETSSQRSTSSSTSGSGKRRPSSCSCGGGDSPVVHSLILVAIVVTRLGRRGKAVSGRVGS